MTCHLIALQCSQNFLLGCQHATTKNYIYNIVPYNILYLDEINFPKSDSYKLTVLSLYEISFRLRVVKVKHHVKLL